jgi:uncharacterized membrane protein YphA (DoxX/SURF4 family)
MASVRTRIIPILAILLGVIMIGGGSTKLIGQPGVAAQFAAFGLPAWFRALVGTFEVIGGILLLVPPTTPVGSLILSTIMVGAMWAHAASGEFPQIVPAAVLLLVFLAIFRRNRSRAVHVLGGA